jgi:6-phosphogluconolactonase
MKTQISQTADDLAADAADFFIAEAQKAIEVRGRFTVALAGGSTPKKTYALLAQPGRSGQVDWAKTFVFFGDERFGDIDSPNSNYGMARQAMLDHVPIPKANIFPMPTGDNPDEDAAADQYIETLAKFFDVPSKGLPPRFDLILLGLGDDGHTASLFPDAASLAVTDAWVVATPPGTLPPPVDRLTFTFPSINAARNVAFLVSGTKKAATVAEVLAGKRGREAHPSEGVQPYDGTLTWLLDSDAAQQIGEGEH